MCGLTLAGPLNRAGIEAFRSRGEQQALISYNLNDTACPVMGQSFFWDITGQVLLKMGFLLIQINIYDQ